MTVNAPVVNGIHSKSYKVSKLQAALEWSRRGYKVFPLPSNSKQPDFVGWVDSATTDPEKIRKIWTTPSGEERDFNIACLTTGLVVLDVDVKDGRPGLENLEGLHIPQDTLIVRTPSGGKHLYFSHDEDSANRVGILGKGSGLDIRGYHGFVVAPGSTIDGVPYVVEHDSPWADPVPEVLLPFLRPPREKRRGEMDFADDSEEALALGRHYLVHNAPIAISGQGGNDATYGVCTKLTRDFGLSEEAATTLLLELWNGRCEPPWDEDALFDIVEHSCRYGQNERGSGTLSAALGDLSEFDALPPPHAKEDEPPAEQNQRRADEIVLFSSFVGRAAPPRKWIVKGMLPERAVTLLYGNGGTGKSLLAIQLGVARALGRPWLGQETKPGRTLLASAEDDSDELHRRVADIAAAEAFGLEKLGDRFGFLDWSGEDCALAVSNGDALQKTAVLDRLRRRIQSFKPDLLVIDTKSKFFAGNEIHRAHAQQFISLLIGICQKHDTTILLLDHPSMSGMATGDGSSGSSQWSNAVRSRLYMHAEEENGVKFTRLEVRKANYGPTDCHVDLTWERGRFTPVDEAWIEAIKEQSANDLEGQVVAALREMLSNDANVSPERKARNNIVAALAKRPDVECQDKAKLWAAVDRLEADGFLRQDDYEGHGKRLRRYVLGHSA